MGKKIGKGFAYTSPLRGLAAVRRDPQLALGYCYRRPLCGLVEGDSFSRPCPSHAERELLQYLISQEASSANVGRVS